MIYLGRLFILIGMAFLFSRAVFAGEPDDFLARADKKAPVANDFINRGLNAQLENVARQYTYVQSNAGRKTLDPKAPCSQETMLELMVDTFDRNFPDIYTPFGSEIGYDLTAGAKMYDETMLKDWVPAYHKMYVASYRVKTKSGEHVMGIDKIDHFFAHGYLSWMTKANGKKNTPRSDLDLLKFNLAQEKGPWGLKSTKVKSYADLAVNQLGEQFWRDLFDKKDPIFECVNGAYVMKKKFDFFKYIDASVDETINCSSFASQDMRNAIVAHSKKLGVQCPASLETCKKLVRDRSPAVAEHTLHPLCRGLTDNQVETPSSLTTKDVINMASGLSGVSNLYPFWFGSGRYNKIHVKPLTTTEAQQAPRQIWSGPLENSVPVDSPKTIDPSGETTKVTTQQGTAQ